MILRALAIWIVLLALAFANGALREAALVPWVGDQRGHQVSSVTLALAIFALTYVSIGWIRPRGGTDAVMVGLLWLVLVLAFEFALGRARGTPWSVLLADYNIAAGRLWVLVLITTAAAPYVAARMRHVIAHP